MTELFLDTIWLLICTLDSQIVESWVKQLTRQRGYSDQMVEDASAVIFTFGSYRLGVRYEQIYFSSMIFLHFDYIARGWGMSIGFL